MKARFFFAVLAMMLLCLGCESLSKKKPIKVGILHSLTGTMAISEKPVKDATLLAIEEINASGGILGRQIQPIIVDGKSDLDSFASGARQLIEKDKVSVVFGCWTSASRKAVKPIFEKNKNLLVYPVQYEGLESSPNILYLGATPNQQMIPAIKWCFDHFGKKFFFVGSDYVYPHAAHAIVKDQLTAIGGEVIGEEYILLGSTDLSEILKKIIALKPDAIINTLNGDSNIAFFKGLRAANITPDQIPVMSFSIGEPEIEKIGAENVEGNFASWNYFQSIDTQKNHDFVEKYKKKQGSNCALSDPMEAAYFGVFLWAQVVNIIETDKAAEVISSLNLQSFNAPEGIVCIDKENQHTWKKVRIGKARKDGQFDIVWESERLIQPNPYPITRTKNEWDQFLESLYQGWEQNWQNLGDQK
jgi:urea transport system substrate-binding protein